MLLVGAGCLLDMRSTSLAQVVARSYHGLVVSSS